MKDVFSALGDYFQDEQEIAGLIDDQLLRIDSWFSNHADYDYEREERSIGRVELPVALTGARSIFDDIDVV